LIIPFGAALAFAQATWERRALEDRIYGRTVAFMDAGGRERCEEDPARFRGTARHRQGRHRRGRGPDARRDVLFAYDAAYRTTSRAAPLAPPALVEALEAGASVALSTRNGRRDVEALVAMPWSEGPCARILVHTRRPEPSISLLPAALLAARVALIALLSLVSPQRRIRPPTKNLQPAAPAPDPPTAIT